jgi:Zn ribbon nucleic-acid-binding protein
MIEVKITMITTCYRCGMKNERETERHSVPQDWATFTLNYRREDGTCDSTRFIEGDLCPECAEEVEKVARIPRKGDRKQT